MRRSRPRSSAFRRSTLPFVLLAATAQAADAPTARDVFKGAVAAQGEMPREIRDVTLSFDGEISEDGEVHTALRTYWYRAADRSFRIRTGSGATDRVTSERGVFGATKFWERTSSGETLELSRGNRDDVAQIRAIDRERAEFERMLRMILLARLDEDGWQVAFAEPAPVRIEKDQPHQAKGTLGSDREATYHVLDLKREGEPDLRLYVQTKDASVRKAIEYDLKDPGKVRFVYYFANYWTDPGLKLLVPRFLSVYRGTPLDVTERDSLLAAKGEPTVRLNTDLKDADLKAPGVGG